MRRPRTPIDTSSSTFDPSTVEPPLDWAAVFGNDRPVELEVGSGKGLFLVNAGRANPDRNFLGIELSKKYAEAAAVRVAKAGAGNVKVVQGDAKLFLAKYVPSASLRAVHIYFPDPWWKARHKKRRVFCEPFVADVERLLIPGGDFHMVTDVEEYFGVMMELMAARPRFVAQPPPGPTDPAHDLDYLTNFERKFRLEGRPIFRAAYRLAAG